jgi:hypothetical protein
MTRWWSLPAWPAGSSRADRCGELSGVQVDVTQAVVLVTVLGLQVRPDGSAGELAFGPEPPGGSNVEAPGAEWGTGFRFDVPGCWRIELSRDDVTAQLAIPVVED